MTPWAPLEFGFVRRLVLSAVIAAGGLGAAASAAAQQTAPADQPPVAAPAQPYRGLFGAGRPAPLGGQVLDLTTSTYQEYGTLTEGAPASGSAVLDPGWFLGVHGLLNYRTEGRDVRFGIQAEGSFRYYRSAGANTLPRYRAAIGLDSNERVRRRTRYRVGASVDYEPYYQLSLFGDSTPVTEGTAILPSRRDDLLYREQRYIFGQSFEVEHAFSPRTSVTVFENLRTSRSEQERADVQSVMAGVRFGRALSRYADLRLGYAYQTGRHGSQTTERIESHDVDLSVEYRRPLPRSRRTTFGFRTGTSRVKTAAQRRWEVVGAANLRHDFDRGWFVQGDYARSVRLVEGFLDPFLDNTASGSVGGFLGRRVEVLTTGGYSRGVVGFSAERYEAVQGSARLRLVLARYLAVDVEGLTARHTFDETVTVPGAFPRDLNRWAIRCNVSVWLPLVG